MFSLQKFIPMFFSIAGVMILFITFRFKLERDTKKEKKKWELFFEQEYQALFKRKQAIPESFFITVCLKNLPLVQDIDCQLFYKQLMQYENIKVANLKKSTNLELKQTYGISQFEHLIEHEKKYFSFMDILLKYGTILYEKKFFLEAKQVLELALDYQCDSSKCYLILADIYQNFKEIHSLQMLSDKAYENMDASYYLDKVITKIDQAKQEIYS